MKNAEAVMNHLRTQLSNLAISLTCELINVRLAGVDISSRVYLFGKSLDLGERLLD
jgi:hypothetical protein